MDKLLIGPLLHVPEDEDRMKVGYYSFNGKPVLGDPFIRSCIGRTPPKISLEFRPNKYGQFSLTYKSFSKTTDVDKDQNFYAPLQQMLVEHFKPKRYGAYVNLDVLII